jgi:hypothetical protein
MCLRITLGKLEWYYTRFMLLAGGNHYFKLLKHFSTKFKTTTAITITTATMYGYMTYIHTYTHIHT